MKYILILIYVSIGIVLLTRCSDDEVSADCSVNDLQLSVDRILDANCGRSDGEIIVSAIGGQGKYSYSLSNGDRNSTGSFTSLNSGNYTITVADETACTVSAELRINDISGVEFGEVSVSNSGCESLSGEISVEAQSGTPPYTFSLDGGEFRSSGSFSGLPRGEYIIRIKDGIDCEISRSVTVPSGISWAEQVEPIILENCALPECHGGSQQPDFRDFENISGNAVEIKSRTQDGSMPPNTVISEEQKSLIACWVDDGAPEN